MFVFIIVTVSSPNWFSPQLQVLWAPGRASCGGLCSCLLPPASALYSHQTRLAGLGRDRVVILQRAQGHWGLEREGRGEGIGNLNAA